MCDVKVKATKEALEVCVVKYVSKATRSHRGDGRAIRRIRKRQEAIPVRKSKSTLNMSHKAVYASRVMESIIIRSQQLMNIVANAFYAL